MSRRPDEERRALGIQYGDYLRRCSERTRITIATTARQVGMQEAALQRMARGQGGPPSSPGLQKGIADIFGEAFVLPGSIPAVREDGGGADAEDAPRTRERIVESTHRRGRPARWPDLVEATRLRTTRVVLAAAHLDSDPTNNRWRNLRALC